MPNDKFQLYSKKASLIQSLQSWNTSATILLSDPKALPFWNLQVHFYTVKLTIGLAFRVAYRSNILQILIFILILPTLIIPYHFWQQMKKFRNKLEVITLPRLSNFHKLTWLDKPVLVGTDWMRVSITSRDSRLLKVDFFSWEDCSGSWG